MVIAPRYRESDVDGTEAGGYVVVNVDAPMGVPCQVLEDASGNTYFRTLTEARSVCRRLRRENENNMIFVYALTGIRQAREIEPSVFP